MTTSDFSERKYCGTLEPLTINTDYYALKIRMKLDYYTAVRNRGLAVGYVIYKSNGGWCLLSHLSLIRVI